MQQIAVSGIVSRVRSAIDELMQNDSRFLTDSEDEKNLTDVIVGKIGYALQYVIENAPLEKLDSSAFETLAAGVIATDFTIDTTTLVGRLKLPTDLLHIIDARLSSWSQFPVPLPDTSQEALMQQDQYARGSWDRPVNILTYDGSDRYLEMYCARYATTGDGHTADTLKFTFIRKPALQHYEASSPSTTVSVPDLLEAALIYQIAGMAMTAFREDVAESLFAISEKYLKSDYQKI